MRQIIADWLNVLMGFRKFIAFVLVFIMAITLRVMGYINGDNLTSMVNITFGAFATGNAIEYFTAAAKSFVSDRNASKAIGIVEQGLKDAPPEDN